ncbi:hypothetical protein ACQW02_15670 [Humitalea sp. 24SJ18S-53]|uniref:hypothetical protein n=1 Tax=Humitalea sp. 24SJ18S-53 TaxID=3422307 RepID=UPI003D667231
MFAFRSLALAVPALAGCLILGAPAAEANGYYRNGRPYYGGGYGRPYYGGGGAAIVGGILGLGAGVAIGSAIAPRYYAPPPVVYAPPPVYYAPPPVYYAPPPVYYAPPPVYYAPPPQVVYPAPPGYGGPPPGAVAPGSPYTRW